MEPALDSLPALSRDELRRVDELAVSELGIPSLLLMENAGRGAAEQILQMLPAAGDGPVAILCGGGNNGGDGAVIARHLAAFGVSVRLLHLRPTDRLRGDAAVQRRIVDRLQIPATSIASEAEVEAAALLLGQASVLVDGLLGTGFQGEPRAPLAAVIRAIEAARMSSAARVVALDLPSGLDCDSGRPASPCVRANTTLSFCAPKLGFAQAGARDWTGEVKLVGLGLSANEILRLLKFER